MKKREEKKNESVATLIRKYIILNDTNRKKGGDF